MADLKKSVPPGASVGVLVGAETAAAVGLAIGAAVPPPFSAVAAPLGAALGALIGFFVGLAKRHEPTPEEIAANNARAAATRQQANEMIAAASNTAAGLGNAAQAIMIQFPLFLAMAALNVYQGGKPIPDQFDDWIATSDAGRILQQTAASHPAYAPLIGDFISSLRSLAKPQASTPGVTPVPFDQSPEGKSMMKLVDFFKALAQMPGDLDADPFAYLRPPMSQYMGPALAAAGVNISDPAVLNMIRGNYMLSRSTPRVKMGIPIARASLNAKSGGRVALDKRAFATKIAPYGVGSFAMFPASAPDPSWTTDNDHGAPLAAPWEYGLDADNFAKPKGSTAATVAKIGVPIGIAAALLFFL